LLVFPFFCREVVFAVQHGTGLVPIKTRVLLQRLRPMDHGAALTGRPNVFISKDNSQGVGPVRRWTDFWGEPVPRAHGRAVLDG
jgi:hypothetical protein